MKFLARVIFYIWLFIFACLLSSCSKKEPYVKIAEQIKSDIVVVEQQIQDIKENLPTECKNTTVKANLTTIQVNLKTITARVEEQVLACDDKRKLLESENSKLKIIIGFLIFIIAGWIILKIKKI